MAKFIHLLLMAGGGKYLDLFKFKLNLNKNMNDVFLASIAEWYLSCNEMVTI